MASQVAVIEFPTGVNGSNRVYQIIRGELQRGSEQVLFISGNAQVSIGREASLPHALKRVSKLLDVVDPIPEIKDTDIIVVEHLHREQFNRLLPKLQESNCKVIALNCHMKGFLV